MLRRKTEWAEVMLDGGVEGPARGTFLRREARGEDASSDEPDERTAGDGAQADGEGTDDAAPHTVMPGDERGAADQQRTDDGHGYAGQGAPGQPGTA